jgi:hypothetical protein
MEKVLTGIMENSQCASQLRRLILTIHQTDDAVGDEAFLEQLMTILKDYKGRDEVYLTIITDEGSKSYKLTNTYIEVTPDMQKKLSRLFKPEDIRVEVLK